ncbi:MAG TPA: hypothetical protein VIG24_12940 [Acidimicrobiia bacterium]
MAHDPTHTPESVLAWKSIKWRNTAGWIVVMVIAWRYLVHPVTSTYLVATGHDPLPPIDNLDLADAAALVGLPIGGSVADRMTGDS